MPTTTFRDAKSIQQTANEMFSVAQAPGGRPTKKNGGPPSTPTPANQPDTRKMVGADGKPLGDLAVWPPQRPDVPAKR